MDMSKVALPDVYVTPFMPTDLVSSEAAPDDDFDQPCGASKPHFLSPDVNGA